jgi:dolichyl-phosphate-mannose-protein mannosyltransferase
MAAWAFHYFPFFLMNRQLFIHHYLPAHLASALVAGSVLNFMMTESIRYPISVPNPLVTRMRPSKYSDFGYKGVLAAVFLVLVVFGMFYYLSPLTYGTPG